MFLTQIVRGKHELPPHCPKPPVFNLRSYFKWNVLTVQKFTKYWEVTPLVAVNLMVLTGMVLITIDRICNTTIDLRFTRGELSLPRWEQTTVPGFVDLRKPRSLKLYDAYTWKPCIHLDNRYRLMRGEPMLDADGNVTDVIGEDESGAVFDMNNIDRYE